jgi:hypothetical protein
MFFSSSQAVREIAPVLRLRGCFDAIEFFNDSRRSIYPGSEWFNEGRTQADRPDGPSPSGLLSHVVAAPALRSAVTGPFWAALACGNRLASGWQKWLFFFFNRLVLSNRRLHPMTKLVWPPGTSLQENRNE